MLRCLTGKHGDVNIVSRFARSCSKYVRPLSLIDFAMTVCCWVEVSCLVRFMVTNIRSIMFLTILLLS
jgi:hypothetical protein